MIKSGYNDTSKSKYWNVLETVLSHLKLFCPMGILVVCYVQAIETNSIKKYFTPFHFSYFFIKFEKTDWIVQKIYKKLNRSVLYTPSSTKQLRKLWYKNNYHV